ncbi:TolC family outer membrane protein [Pseudomonas sp. 21LCFQ02]|uniref:TolC family outer membrane protein n=1 Tax=unclassified Pseudomonas TaxID=196821 RepID=UPI0004F90766|nr:MULTISPECIES: TolC family outer membrane protein [unclassified Pseudomonas]MCO8170996.1 TolC family outer membrane protein [Pseudomonas sp. 21LCFQ02]MCQ9425634.1 TolC family outer membrane protein [Pseudomonas sp. LJDD11]BAP45963.1 outer membrane channel protein TolC [Pseudomonas sp. StFLB209]
MIVRLIPCVLSGLLVLQAHADEPKTAVPSTPKPPPTSVSAKEYSADLMTLYKESRLEDPRILSAYARAQAGKEHEREAFGSLLPQISANAGANRIKQVNEQVDQVYNSENYSIGLSQVLYNKKAWENWQRYKSLAKQSLSESDEAQAEATVDLAQRYFAALAADDELELTQAERRATQKNLDQVSALYERQYAKKTDVLELQARVDLLAAQEVDARNQVRVTRAALSEIVGRPVTEKLSRVRDDVQLKVSEQTLESWVQLAQTENPAIKSNLSAVEAAQAGVRGGKGDHYPSLSLNLSAQNTNEGYNNALAPKTDSYVAGVALSVPIYSGGSTSARVRGLYQDQVAAEQQLEFTRRQVVKETTNAYLTADSSVEKIRANRNAVSSAEQSSIASQEAFKYGVVNAVDVLTATQNEFKARRDLLKTQYDFITNLFILNRWAGKLSVESVESVNVWLSNNRKTEPAPDRKTKQ